VRQRALLTRDSALGVGEKRAFAEPAALDRRTSEWQSQMPAGQQLASYRAATVPLAGLQYCRTYWAHRTEASCAVVCLRQRVEMQDEDLYNPFWLG